MTLLISQFPNLIVKFSCLQWHFLAVPEGVTVADFRCTSKWVSHIVVLFTEICPQVQIHSREVDKERNISLNHYNLSLGSGLLIRPFKHSKFNIGAHFNEQWALNPSTACFPQLNSHYTLSRLKWHPWDKGKVSPYPIVNVSRSSLLPNQSFVTWEKCHSIQLSL